MLNLRVGLKNRALLLLGFDELQKYLGIVNGGQALDSLFDWVWQRLIRINRISEDGIAP